MCFAMNYRICGVLSRGWRLHKSDFPLQDDQKYIYVVLSQGSYLHKRIFHCKTVKNTCLRWIMAFELF